MSKLNALVSDKSKLKNSSKDLGTTTKEMSKGKITKVGSADEYSGVQFFNFPNGDLYVGHFKATIKEDIVRQGYGKYFCNDGSIYSGIWMEDQLVEARNITFNDGDSYEGPLQNFQFSGIGNYSMAQAGKMQMKFIDNNPVGEISLTDIYGFHWKGYCTDNDNEATLFPINHFKNIKQFEENHELTNDATENIKDKK